MISEVTQKRITEAANSAPFVEGEAHVSSVLLLMPASRDEALTLAGEARDSIIDAEWDAEGLYGATYEMQVNARRALPVLRAKRRFADLCVAVIDEVDAEEPQVGPVGALMVAVMSIAAWTGGAS
ncbi:hypothetical protein [Streptomyces huasconensis]|uniref:hypothetical protein n=1 Tax=Streptomyces huasconensis TaxID=1854574 RepID=UPI0036FED0A8